MDVDANIRFHSQVNIAETTQPAEVERIQVLRWLASQLPEGILRFGRTCTGGSTWRLVETQFLAIIWKKETAPQFFQFVVFLLDSDPFF